ncbi:hypothetical protein KAJ89_05075 [Candidatus Parcubacteria bacterium]|nr:hypothetical protein [Candidatus Parcubacteria bacterium]
MKKFRIIKQINKEKSCYKIQKYKFLIGWITYYLFSDVYGIMGGWGVLKDFHSKSEAEEWLAREYRDESILVI